MAPDEASRIGLVDTVVEQEELVPEAVRRAASLARMPAAAYALTKEQLHRFTRGSGSRSCAQSMTVGPPVCGRCVDQARAAVAQYLGRLGRERAPRPD